MEYVCSGSMREVRGAPLCSTCDRSSGCLPSHTRSRLPGGHLQAAAGLGRLAASGAALQITACDLSAFEIILVFLRIKLNPDHSSEPVYSSVPRTFMSPQPRGEQTLARERASEGRTSASLLCCRNQQLRHAWPDGGGEVVTSHL